MAREKLAIAFERQKGLCIFCEERMDLFRTYGVPKRFATLEHVQPKSKGGRNHHSNYAASCARCNNMRGDIPFDLFKSVKPWLMPTVERKAFLRPFAKPFPEQGDKP